MDEHVKNIVDILKEDRDKWLSDRNILLKQRKTLRRNLDFMSTFGHQIDLQNLITAIKDEQYTTAHKLINNLHSPTDRKDDLIL